MSVPTVWQPGLSMPTVRPSCFSEIPNSYFCSELPLPSSSFSTPASRGAIPKPGCVKDAGGTTADSHPQWSKSPICVEETSLKMGKNTKSGPLCPVTTDFYATLKLTPIETPCPGSSHQPLPKPKASPPTNVSVTPLLFSLRCTSPDLLHPNPTSKVQHLPSPGPHNSLLLPPSHSSSCQAGHSWSTEPLYTPRTQPLSFSWWPGM